MIKALKKVGKDQALILPARMVIKYKLGKKVMIEETEDGILIHATDKKLPKESSFQKRLAELRKNKAAIQKKIRDAANNPEVQAYYANPKNRFDDVDPDVIDY